MATVELEDLEKRYGDVHVVRRLNLRVAHGEFVVLVGASGCGKSTTLRMVAGLDSVTAGTIRIGDRVVNEVSPRDRDIAMVFQSYALYPHMTVRENMAFGLQLRQTPAAEIDKRVRAAATMLGLTDLLGRKPAALSGGQRQRVAMGRAVVREPQVFLFDEPLSNLDAKLRVQMRLEIARLHRRLGATMVYVTHDQVEAMTLADRIAVMHEGLLQQCAPPAEVYGRPANTYVATFIGSPAMNLWPVTATRDADGLCLRGNGLDVHLDAAAAERVRAAIEALPQDGAGGREVTLGVRPEDVDVAAIGDAVLAVDVVEPLGAETIVYGQFDGHEPARAHGRDPPTLQRHEGPAIVRVAPSTQMRAGDKVPVRLRRDRLHVFDVHGLRLAHADGPP
ncbi:MAG: sn-glycerol-3-phosphate ABC transporter ATP-binding protein UgpC [Myxococcales bacterium]|nr:sn-glycerol-3-phosphate ABC transporter ATP-binding protein UgpC [Myxococcales bacterium]